jgi:hypothetical protein
MSVRRERTITNIFTYPDEALEGLTRKQQIELGKKDVKALTQYFRRLAMKKEWKYTLWICASMFDLDTNKEIRLHLHVVLKCCPGYTGMRYLQVYWRKLKKNCGNPSGLTGKNEDVYNLDYFLNHYMKRQSITGKVCKQSNEEKK